MKSILFVVFLAAAATAAVVSNEVPDVVELPDVFDGDEVADEDLIETPEVVVTDVNALTDVTDLTDVADETAVASRTCNCDSSLSQGIISPHDWLMYNAEHRANATQHPISRDIAIRTDRQITAIRVTQIGISQNATPAVVSGGIGNFFVTIRIRSAPNLGYHYRVKIYGR